MENNMNTIPAEKGLTIDELYLLAKGMYQKSSRLNNKIRLTRGSGWHKPEVVFHKLLERKIELVVNDNIKKGAINVTNSMSTRSAYFTLEDINYRVSDHLNKSFDGQQIIVKL